MTDFENAHALLREFKGDSYLFGKGVLEKVGETVRRAGNRAALVRDTFEGSGAFVKIITDSLAKAGVELGGVIKGARPNCPREDLFRISDELKEQDPDVIVSFGSKR